MKKLLSLLAIVLLVPLARAEDRKATPNGPERTIHEFYQWYVQALLANQDPFGKRRADLKRFATERLISEIDGMRKGPDGLDGDYFLDAQDFDKDWAKNISVSNVSTQGNRVTADVRLKGREMGTRELHVTLLREGDTWKVDRVKGQQ